MKSFSTITWVLACGLLFAACTKEEPEQPDEPTVPVAGQTVDEADDEEFPAQEFSLNTAPDTTATKAYLDGSAIKWSGSSEQCVMWYRGNGTSGTSKYAASTSTTATSGATSATFAFTLNPDNKGAHTWTAFYPASKLNGGSTPTKGTAPTALGVTLPNTQTPTTSTFDTGAFFACSPAYSSSGDSFPATGTAHFKPLVAVVKLTLTLPSGIATGAGSQSTSIDSIRVSCGSKTLAGKAAVNMSTGALAGTIGTAKAIKLITTGITIPSNRVLTLYFTCYPQSFTTSDKLRIRLIRHDGYWYDQEFPFSSAYTQDKAKLNTLSANISSATLRPCLYDWAIGFVQVLTEWSNHVGYVDADALRCFRPFYHLVDGSSTNYLYPQCSSFPNAHYIPLSYADIGNPSSAYSNSAPKYSYKKNQYHYHPNAGDPGKTEGASRNQSDTWKLTLTLANGSTKSWPLHDCFVIAAKGILDMCTARGSMASNSIPTTLAQGDATPFNDLPSSYLKHSKNLTIQIPDNRIRCGSNYKTMGDNDDKACWTSMPWYEDDNDMHHIMAWNSGWTSGAQYAGRDLTTSDTNWLLYRVLPYQLFRCYANGFVTRVQLGRDTDLNSNNWIHTTSYKYVGYISAMRTLLWMARWYKLVLDNLGTTYSNHTWASIAAQQPYTVMATGNAGPAPTLYGYSSHGTSGTDNRESPRTQDLAAALASFRDLCRNAGDTGDTPANNSVSGLAVAYWSRIADANNPQVMVFDYLRSYGQSTPATTNFYRPRAKLDYARVIELSVLLFRQLATAPTTKAQLQGSWNSSTYCAYRGTSSPTAQFGNTTFVNTNDDANGFPEMRIQQTSGKYALHSNATTNTEANAFTLKSGKHIDINQLSRLVFHSVKYAYANGNKQWANYIDGSTSSSAVNYSGYCATNRMMVMMSNFYRHIYDNKATIIANGGDVVTYCKTTNPANFDFTNYNTSR